MENFVVSARKYRPDSFETVVGQPSITRTLKNAIGTKQIAHAYLFTGPRGVGKTTCARIFAKTINCFNPGPNSEACNTCESCESFQSNRSFNIHELDAASNNHVDDIRNLIDQIRIPPQVGKYSIYIIDEVHMLSQQAFNAFLKTLEEPPAHAVFILATTEKHKILPTILSRCQIFDFKRITVREMMTHLAEVAGKESVEIDDTATNIIAQKADGSMRDALSIFDQVVSFSGKVVDYRAIIENLNVLDYDYYFRMTQSFLSGKYTESLKIFDEVLENGFDPRNYLSGLGKHFRNLLMCKDEQTLELLELSGEVADQYKTYSKKCSVSFLFQTLNILAYSDINYKMAKDARLHVEVALLKLSALIGDALSAKSEAEIEPVKTVESVEKREPEVKATAESATVPKTEPKAEVTPRAEAKPEVAATAEAKPEVEAVIEKAKTPVSNIPLKTGPRIRDFMNGANGSPKTPDTPDEVLEKEDEAASEVELNQENLNQLWLSFAESIKKDQPRLFNTLTTQKPVLNEDNMISLNLNNPLQEKAMASIQSEILAYIKKKTGNQELSLETVVPQDNTEKRLYTQDEKFKHLQDQNPQLGLFRNTFNLDFE